MRKLLFPDPWSWLLIWVIMGLLIVLTITGVLLTFWYVPGTDPVVYDGTYALLRGEPVSEAFASVMTISFEIRGGLLIRQIHHWATILLNAGLVVYVARLFFGGLYRAPRRPLWLGAIGMVLLGLAAGLTGYVLPDDLLSGATLWISSGLILSIPVLGTRLHDLAFGGEFPGDFLDKMYWLHIAVVPVAIAGLLALLVWWARRARTPNEAPPRYPRLGVAGTILATAGVVTLMAALLQITPVWLYGPSDPASAGSGAQPDWYLGFVDGALRIFPNWEVSIFGGTLSLAVLVPGILFPGVFFTVLVLVPFIESRFANEPGPAYPARLRDAPRRTALGVASLVLYGTLLASGGVDIIAVQFHLGVETLLWFFRVAVVVGPLVAFEITRRICTGLAQRDLDAGDGTEGTVFRSSEGGFSGHPDTPSKPLSTAPKAELQTERRAEEKGGSR